MADHRHSITVPISFGDCDPAGIVFYPNVYKWFDHLFHDWLRAFGGHALLCDKLDAIGIGLVEAGAKFHHPMHDGDRLTLQMATESWGAKTLHLRYLGHVGTTHCLTGHEVRAVFGRAQSGLSASDVSGLRQLIDGPEAAR
jgi:4-hydroxybenzoyl-CoA thioesterase